MRLASNLRNLELVLFWLMLFALAPAQMQWPQPTFDAASVVIGSNSDSMVELLNFNGTGGIDTLAVRIYGPTLVAVRITDLTTGWSFSDSGYALPAGSMVPVSGVGGFGPNDGRDDAVLAVGRTVWVFSAPAGGVAGQVALLTLSAAVTGTRIGDFNGDGNGDLAVLTNTQIVVYLWTGPGTTTAISTPLPVGSGSLLISGEFTGDTAADLAVVGSQVNFYQLAGASLITSGSQSVGLSDPMPDAGDIDQDGDTDVVIFGMTQYVVLRRTSPGTFSAEAPVAGGPATRLVDVDGDGDLDGACCSGGGSGPPAILSTPSTFHVSVNDQGVFLPAYTLPGIGSWHLAGVADINGDGLRDLAAGRAIYFARQSLGVNPWAPGPSAPISPQTVGDVDGDGDPDWGISASTVHWNDGRGIPALSALPLIDPLAPGTTYGGPAIVGDFDGDGDLDLVVDVRTGGVATGTRLLLGRGAAFADGGTALPPGIAISPWTGSDSERILVADVNLDGRDDLITRSAGPASWSHLWLGTGGQFAFNYSFNSEVVVAVADLTGDGITDALVSDSRLLLRRGLSGGGFAPPEVLNVPPYSGYPYFNALGSFNQFTDSVALGDFDLDGDLDVVAGERTSTGGCHPVVLRNAAGAVPPFTTPTALPGFVSMNGAEPARILSGDVDRDGYLDVVVSNPTNASSNGAGVTFGNGASFFFDDTRAQTLLVTIRALADVDGDGDLDGLGPSIILNRTFEGPTTGARRQWGSGTAGSVGFVPVLGATGPIAAGEPLELRINGAVGAANGLLALGTQTTAIPLLGGTLHVIPDSILPFTCTGTLGLLGDGRFTLAFAPLPASLAGATFHFQAAVADSSATAALTLTSALALNVGL